MHSTDRVLGEFQRPKLGDAIGYGSNRMRIERIHRERVLARRSEDGNWVGTFVPRSDNGVDPADQPQAVSFAGAGCSHGDAADGAGVLLMERKMLLGIKRRAERLAATDPRLGPLGRHEQDAPV